MLVQFETLDPARAFPERYALYEELRDAMPDDWLHDDMPAEIAHIETLNAPIPSTLTHTQTDRVKHFTPLMADLSPTEIWDTTRLEFENLRRTQLLFIGRPLEQAYKNEKPTSRLGEYTTTIPLALDGPRNFTDIVARPILVTSEIITEPRRARRAKSNPEAPDVEVGYMCIEISGHNAAKDDRFWTYTDSGTDYFLHGAGDDEYRKPYRSPARRLIRMLQFSDALSFVERNQAEPNSVSYRQKK
jgi:hypothetical protein